MSSKAVESATNYLKGNADGSGNVHDHLSQVILKLFSEGHNDALELLEHVSVMVKTGAKPRDAPERKPSARAACVCVCARARARAYVYHRLLPNLLLVVFPLKPGHMKCIIKYLNCIK